MASKTQYASVSDLLRDVVPDEEFHLAFDELVARRKLIKQLLAMRAAKGMSQKDVAAKMCCTQSRVSKLENANDDDVRLGDLRGYADVVGCELIAWPMPQDMTPVDKVKCHTHAIKKHMDDLAQLARADDKIAEGVARFFYELFVNFTLMLRHSSQDFPLRPDDTPYLHFECGPVTDGPPSREDDSDSFLEAKELPQTAL